MIKIKNYIPICSWKHYQMISNKEKYLINNPTKNSLNDQMHICLMCLNSTENRCSFLQNSVGADTMQMYVCISQTLHDLYWSVHLTTHLIRAVMGNMLKYVGFSPPASASGPFPTGLSPPHCIFPNKKLLPETCQITHVTRVYLNTLHLSDNVDKTYNEKAWQMIRIFMINHAWTHWPLNSAALKNNLHSHLVSPSAFAMWPNTWANEFGMIPLSSGTALTPSIVNVFPVPVWPYANMVPEKKW